MNTSQKKKDNVWIDIIVNVIAPTIILSKLSEPERLGPVKALILALLLPLCFGVFKLIQSKKINFIALLGLISILISGSLGLLKLDGFWFAVKEAAVPALIGIFVFFSASRPKNLIHELFFNDHLLHLEQIEKALQENGRQSDLNTLIQKATMYMSCSFFLSALLNFILAIYILKSPAGTPEFNTELAKMNALSIPVITVPTLAVTIFIFKRVLDKLSELTGLSMDLLLKK